MLSPIISHIFLPIYIAFASRNLNKTETQYPQIEKEMLSKLFSCTKFHNCINGYHTTMWTDHSPLTSIIIL